MDDAGYICSMQTLKWGDAQTHHVLVGTTLLVEPWRYHAAALADFAPTRRPTLPLHTPRTSFCLTDNNSSRHGMGCMTIHALYKSVSGQL